MSLPKEYQHPARGENTGYYVTSDDGSLKIAALVRVGVTTPEQWGKIYGDIKNYRWNDGDFMLASYAKNGTHFMWEIMTMLLNNSAEFIKQPKEACMMDLIPLSKTDEVFPRGSPRVLNTHYRLDVLPKVFQGRKTILVIRNPKDAATSYFHHYKAVLSNIPDEAVAERAKAMTFQELLRIILHDLDMPHGTYFDYTETMWKMAKDNPNFLTVFYEDMVKDPVRVIGRVNVFMGTNGSSALIQEIADATNFAKMKEEKDKKNMEDTERSLFAGVHGEAPSGDSKPAPKKKPIMYRKGKIGDWKNHFTVADNELFDNFMESWSMSKEIPFTYE